MYKKLDICKKCLSWILDIRFQSVLDIGAHKKSPTYVDFIIRDHITFIACLHSLHLLHVRRNVNKVLFI